MKNSILLLVIGFGLLMGCGKDDVEEDPLTYEEQLAIDVEIIDNYLDEHSITAEEDSTGLRYVIKEEGDGARPNLGNNIVVKYEGRMLSDGTVFDGNMDSDDTLNYPLNRLIKGWQIGLPKINGGGSITLYVPSGLAYGPYGSGPIPANANLIFDIDLLEVQ